MLVFFFFFFNIHSRRFEGNAYRNLYKKKKETHTHTHTYTEKNTWKYVCLLKIENQYDLFILKKENITKINK